MASEPLEAEFIFPPALSAEQEEEYRQLDHDGPLGRALSRIETAELARAPTFQELEAAVTLDGTHVVTFDQGKGEDPREWKNGKRWYVTISAAFLCLAVAIGSAIVTGDMAGPTKDLHTTQEIVNLTVSCFVIGFGIGPLFFAPLSEVVGRSPMYTASMFFFFIFTLPSALAKNAATLVVSRQIAGIAASAPMCNVGGSVADVWSVAERGVPMAVFSFTIFMGPCIGPLIGGWIGQRAGWRWIYWVLFIFSGFCFCLTIFLPETLAPVLLRKKAKKLRKETGDPQYKTLQEVEAVPFSEIILNALIRPLKMLIFEPIVTFMSFYLAFVYSLLYLLFFAFPIAFTEIRGFSGGMTGVTFISVMLGIAIAMCVIPFQEKIYRNATANGAFPEARLYPMMIGCWILPIALFIFAFTGAYEWVHWIAPCVAGALFGFSMILIYISANSYIVDSYSSMAASAIAAKTLLRSEVGAIVPLYVTQMFHNMGFQYAGLLLALISVVIAPIPFFFFKYGEGVRMRSALASKARKLSSSDVGSEKKNPVGDEKSAH